MSYVCLYSCNAQLFSDIRRNALVWDFGYIELFLLVKMSLAYFRLATAVVN